MRVILFDIDGTLLHSGGAGRRGMVKAFADLFGVSDGFSDIPMAGMTDGALLREALSRIGKAHDESIETRFKEKYFAHLVREIAEAGDNKRLMPGVRGLLDALSGAGDSWLLGLLTGNWRESGCIKLAHFGIDGYFGFGSFSDDSEDRDVLFPIALERARAWCGAPVRAEAAWVIGDTPRDVRCGRLHGGSVLGVATGPFSTAELEAAGATRAVRDLSDTARVVSILAGQG